MEGNFQQIGEREREREIKRVKLIGYFESDFIARRSSYIGVQPQR
jgi:hypothetical protein